MWIKFYRKFLNWEWYSDINTKTLFLHCLLKANWKDGKFEGITIPKGSFATSLPKLSEETGLSIQQVRTSLKRLNSTGELTNKSYSKFRVISVKNYDTYQDTNSQTNSQLTGSQQSTNSNNRIIEYKNIDIYYYLEQEFGRTITSPEYQKLAEWKQWFNDDIIKFAIDKTILNGARALSYTEAIINSWHDRGYKTLEECKNEIQAQSKELVKEVFDYDWLNEE